MLNQSYRLSLQTKMTMMVALIAGIYALTTELIEPSLIQQTVENNVLDRALGVSQFVDENITDRAHFSDLKARTKELDKLMVIRPDLLNIVLYTFPTEPGENPLPAASSGPTELPRQEGVPVLVQRVRKERQLLIDYPGQTHAHRAFIAAPIYVKHAVVGATYAEFSTLQMDEALSSLRQASRTRRLFMWMTVVIAINLFLYFKVHRPVKQVLSGIKSLSEGTITASVPVEEQDEMGELASTFNDMVKQIRQVTQDNAQLTESLHALNESLQTKVNEATVEVQEKNRALARTNELLSEAQRDAARMHRLSAIGQVAATVAHKIGTPLTALSGHIQLMTEDSTLSAESRQRLQTVEAQIERTSKIIQDMLIYARRPEPVRSPLDLNACAAECLALLQPEFERRHIALVTEWNHRIEKVDADAQQLQEVFINLIENALDAMQAGGTLVVRVFPYAVLGEPDHRAWVAMEFYDTGCGMDARQLAQIFQPFFTTKKSGSGTGLGLAIALETVRLHGGQINVESEPEKGSRFTIVLPTDGGTR